MIALATIAGLHQRQQTLAAYCPRCNRWGVRALAARYSALSMAMIAPFYASVICIAQICPTACLKSPVKPATSPKSRILTMPGNVPRHVANISAQLWRVHAEMLTPAKLSPRPVH